MIRITCRAENGMLNSRVWNYNAGQLERHKKRDRRLYLIEAETLDDEGPECRDATTG